MEVIWVVVVVGLLILFAVNRVVKRVQGARGRDRCASCRARLKFTGVGKSSQMGVKSGYATICSRCGATQPWAES